MLGAVVYLVTVRAHAYKPLRDPNTSLTETNVS